MVKYEKAIIGQFEEVVNQLQDDIGTSGFNINFVDESSYTNGDTKIAVQFIPVQTSIRLPQENMR